MIPATIDLGCGTAVSVRSSRLASVYNYRYDAGLSPGGAEDKQFELDVVVVTTHGHWEFHGRDGEQDIDDASLALGVFGDEYGCLHDRRQGDSNLIAGLDSRAVDPDHGPLFSKQVIPSGRSLRLLQAAAQSENDDRFDTLMFTLFDLASQASFPASQHSSSRLRMQRAKRFIEMHAFERITLPDMAGELGLSPFTFLRQFRRAIGKTPHAYLHELRVERARHLLARTNLRVEAVARAIGVEDQAYFARLFKKATGYSPSSFRQMVRP